MIGRIIRHSIILSMVLMAFSCNVDQTVKESSFCKSLVAGQYILESGQGWWHWGMAPIYDENGKLHIFMSAIPKAGSWATDSKIVHYTADTPEGPYQFIDTTFASNTASYHNPQISKVGNTYVLVFLLRNASNSSNQEVGIATATSLFGPWTESPYNPIIKASGQLDGANLFHASNPTFLVDEDGKYRVYFKSITDKYAPKRYREISLATSDHIEGPYVNYPDNPLISYADSALDIEDPYAFYYEGRYYMITEDRMNVKQMLEGEDKANANQRPGGWRPGLFFTSADGINWDRPEISYQTNEFYFKEELARTERPSILWKDGKPEYLFLACHDEYATAGFFLKIDNWK